MSEERRMIRDLVAQVAQAHPAVDLDGQLPAAWPVLDELGVGGIGVPEERGGFGGGLDELVELVRSLGRHALSSPAIEASVANWLISQEESIDDRLATVAITDAATNERGRLTATLPVVPWARAADRVVCVTPDDGSFLVALDQPGVTVMAAENLAGEQRDEVALLGVAARPLRAEPDVAEVRARLGLLWAAALTGAGEGALALTSGYVREREQFGQPLVRLPAVASGLAGVRVQLTQMDAAVARATQRLPADPGDADRAVAVARVVTARAATAIATLAHQLHGAMGMTKEYPLHHYSRRLWAWRDAETSERAWTAVIGGAATAGGEEAVWERLTA
jgi:acyl-CoA dehydrogenase